MYVADNILRAHGLEELLPVDGQMLRHDPQNVQMAHRIRAFRLFLHIQTRNLREHLVVAAHDLLLPLRENLQLVQLALDQCRLHLRNPVVGGKRNLLIIPGAVRHVLHHRPVSGDPVGARQEESLIIFLIVCQDRAAFAAGDGFHRMEA